MSPPDPEAMKEVMAHQYEACRRAGIPIGVLPNIEVSLVVQPEEGRELAKPASWPRDAPVPTRKSANNSSTVLAK